jgi:hypothetical protein
MHMRTYLPPNAKKNGARAALLVGAVATLLTVSIAQRAPAADAETLEEYQGQFQALPSDDVEGHVKLALWCRDQEEWGLLATQSKHVLTLDPDHRLAKLLLDLARSKGADPVVVDPADVAAGTSSTSSQPPVARQGTPGLLTADQVQALRHAELRLDGSERLQVEFRNQVDERFLDYMTLREGLTPQQAIAFRRMNPTQKAVTIIGKVREYERAALPEEPFDDDFSADVIIKNDPLIFKEYITRVWPIIGRGCATAGCHSGPKASEPVLLNSNRMTEEMHYTNYLILNDHTRGDARMINRDFPHDSLVLVYGQPIAGNQGTVHPAELRPIFQSPNDRQYVTIGRWITALRVPAPDYGVTAEDLK